MEYVYAKTENTKPLKRFKAFSGFLVQKPLVNMRNIMIFYQVQTNSYNYTRQRKFINSMMQIILQLNQ